MNIQKNIFVLIGVIIPSILFAEIETDRFELTYDTSNAFQISDIGLNDQAKGAIRDKKGYGLAYTFGLTKTIGLFLGASQLEYQGQIYDQATISFTPTSDDGTEVTSDETNVEYRMNVDATLVRYGISLLFDVKGGGDLIISNAYLIELGRVSSFIDGKMKLLMANSNEPFITLKMRQESGLYAKLAWLFEFEGDIYGSLGSKTENFYSLELESCDEARIGSKACGTVKRSLSNRSQEYKPLKSLVLGLGMSW